MTPIATALFAVMLSLNQVEEGPPFRLFSAAPPEPLADPPAITDAAVFELNVDATGTIIDIELLKGQPPFIAHSREALNEWGFTPLQTRSSPVRVSATFLYKPQTALSDKPSVFHLPTPLEAEDNESPFPVKIVVPGYPIGGFGEGSVILQASVGRMGQVLDVEVIRQLPSLTDIAVGAVRNWKFTPAGVGAAQVRRLPRVAIVVIWFHRPEYAALPD